MRRASAVALAAAVWAVLVICPGEANAAKVVFMTRGGHAVVRQDPSLPAQAVTPEPATTSTVSASRREARRGSSTTVLTVLRSLERRRKITKGAYYADRGAFYAALTEVRRLPSARAAELDAVVEILHGMAVDGTLTAARLPVLFLTLDRNREYWRSGPLLSYADRVEFAGSELVWEYYPGQGLALQQLGTFGKANALCTAGAADRKHCEQIISEMVGAAVHRAGGLAWEYYFNFDGGAPPWTSAMSQATGIQALTHAYEALGDATYLKLAHSALALFTHAPPSGVGVETARGMRYVQYSFASSRSEEVINAFLQTLIGLDEYARESGDPLAARLFEEGNAEAKAELPSFVAGGWSFYQPGVEDDLSYHELVTGFLHQLCSLTKTPIYCTTAAAFTKDLTTPPALSLRTTKVTARKVTDLYFTLSKISHVGIVIRRDGVVVFGTSAPFPYGENAFAIPALPARGTYRVTLDATDLAGNYSRILVPLKVVTPRRRRKH